ncbi:MAG TPA: aconitate hydratase AcnA [Actinomycetota bacterium]|nr:aconitate hydratase AcnA [Actinomycetota bacterium]
MKPMPTPGRAKDTLEVAGGSVGIARLDRVVESDLVARLPYVVRLFLENALRHQGRGAEAVHLDALSGFPSGDAVEFPFFPGRVVLQDFTGVPCVADLAAMRGAVARLGGDPARVNPVIPADLVIDHSVLVDFFGMREAFGRNVELEYERNRERYAFLRWAQRAFRRMMIVPPGAGIVHQVNLEFLARVVMTEEHDGETVAYPDTLVGTDSHTTMIGGVGVLGWGVGGIEAEAAMLGEPVTMLTPVVVGVKLTGALPSGATATDLVLALTELLRKHGVVGKFVEFYGDGLSSLAVPDRATISNMSPEYGATEGVFPVDEQTLTYLRATGRDPELIDLVERYTKEQGLWREPGAEPSYSETLAFDLSSVEPSMAGPKRPQDRVTLPKVPDAFHDELDILRGAHAGGVDNGSVEAPVVRSVKVSTPKGEAAIGDGSVVIAAITSCTNTSNPSVMVGAGLLARNAAARGLRVPPTVKTSLAPGSPVVEDYLRRSGLLEELEKLNFYLVGFGCTTCIGNSGPLPDEVASAIEGNDLAAAAVLSGNRNFEGRIHPQVRLAFLASPPLVVAYALAGTVDIDLTTDPLGTDREGNPVFLRDIWPAEDEVRSTIEGAMDPDSYRSRFASITDGDERWRSLPVPEGDLYEWDAASTYIAEPPFLQEIGTTPEPVTDIAGARVLVWVGDSVTTDHISPAGSIKAGSPAGEWLAGRGVTPDKLHSYGARRGNHDVMVRGTFANIRLRNKLVPGTEGGVTEFLPTGEQTTIFDASTRYQADGIPLLILAGKEYGAGSSRDWAAKGTALLGVRAVIAESYERIHRSNLVQMGVLPLEYAAGETAESLGLTGRETFDIAGVAGLTPGGTLPVVARREDGSAITFEARARIDTPTELHYFREGGILPAVLRKMIAAS